jgi:hypothetical protein
VAGVLFSPRSTLGASDNAAAAPADSRAPKAARASSVVLPYGRSAAIKAEPGAGTNSGRVSIRRANARASSVLEIR